jgi:hypothetical protein
VIGAQTGGRNVLLQSQRLYRRPCLLLPGPRTVRREEPACVCRWPRPANDGKLDGLNIDGDVFNTEHGNRRGASIADRIAKAGCARARQAPILLTRRIRGDVEPL